MKKVRLILVVIVFLAALPFIVPLFSLWSRINVTESEMDLSSGRVRHTVYFYWINVKESYHHTPLSKELYNGGVSSPDGEWAIYGSSGIYVKHSPHYAYHSALFQAKQLKMIWEMNDTAASQRKEQATAVLKLWGYTESDDLVDEYLDSFLTEEYKPNKSMQPIHE